MDAEELIEERTGENEYERKARELGELLQELRVMLPGVQVLFAFLLTVPFSARFGYLTPVQQAVFFGTLLYGSLRGAVAGAVGPPQATVAAAGQGASPAGGESSRYRGHGAASSGDGRGDVRDHRPPIRLCRRRRGDRRRQRLLPLRVVLDAASVSAERKVAAPEALRRKVLWPSGQGKRMARKVYGAGSQELVLSEVALHHG